MSQLSMNPGVRRAPFTFILCIDKQQAGPRPESPWEPSLRNALLGLEYVADQVDDAVAVAPLVVVPGDELDEVLVQSDSSLGVKDARPEWKE
jgi:hypothetical protein